VDLVGQIKEIKHDGSARSDVVWLRNLANLAQAGTWQKCDMADGLVSARIVHDEGMAQPRQKVGLGLERLRIGTWY
jgi:hypothetical protein